MTRVCSKECDYLIVIGTKTVSTIACVLNRYKVKTVIPKEVWSKNKSSVNYLRFWVIVLNAHP